MTPFLTVTHHPNPMILAHVMCPRRQLERCSLSKLEVGVRLYALNGKNKYGFSHSF